MKIFRTNRVSEVGVFSLDNVRLFVGEVSRSSGSRRKGIALAGALFGNFPVERAIVLSDADALRLVGFLDGILSGTLPSSFSVKANLFERMTWNVARDVERWHDGGGVRGTISYGGILGVAVVPVTSTRESIESLRKCMVEFYSIAD